MRKTRYIIFSSLFLFLCQISLPAFSQLGVSFDIKKPRQYEDRVLKSEKPEKKFNLPRRFIQNTVTHYNYFFNANNKLNEVIERAKESFLEDYSQLLPFYNYSLDVTASEKVQLDSVISKSMAGIVLHDLRSDWVDDMYLLWGAAFYLRKEFDSAYLTFQFINYAFAEKEKDGYYKYIGSKMDGNSALSISTREKNTLPKKIFSSPPSRNDAFIWQIRTHIARDEFTEAASLIETLKNDPVFPKRLNTDMHEVQAWWFYKREMWDSAAVHLSLALDNATTKQERARWEYLVAQLYELAGKYAQSQEYYARSINHATDPILDIYARLNSIRTNKDGGENYIDKNIASLLKMARRDKYVDYRDVIYYMAAQMELERNNTEAAQQLLYKGTEFNNGNTALRNRSFLQLAELAFSEKHYRRAYNFYDSLKLEDPTLAKNVEKITERKLLLGKIATQVEIKDRQDSLQHVAAMPEDQRKDFIRSLVRKIRREQGLKDESNTHFAQTPILPVVSAPDLFNSTQSKGEWYFYNASVKTRGAVDFKSKWGNRSNVDNWRRSGAATTRAGSNTLNPSGGTNPGADQTIAPEISYDALNDNLPLTPEKIKISSDSIRDALFTLGKIYAEEMEDCHSVIETFEELQRRFPDFEKMDEVLFTLYYCYTKSGETAKAAQVKKLMSEKYPSGNLTAIVKTGKDPKAPNPEATKTYEGIYDLFLAGRFTEALDQKKRADSLYGESYWTPQQSYIEAVYYIKERQDSSAITVLNKIIARSGSSPLALKASNLINVLGRRSQIEEELRNLKVQGPPEEPVRRTDSLAQVQTQPVRSDTVAKKLPPPARVDTVKNTASPKTDTTTKKAPPVVVTQFMYTPEKPHNVVLVLNKVDVVYANEAKNAIFRYNREKFYNQPLDIKLIDLDADNKLLLISPFTNAQAAVDYVQKAKPLANTEIMPWLKTDRYSFSIITDSNLTILLAKPDIVNYKKFMEQYLPGKF